MDARVCGCCAEADEFDEINGAGKPSQPVRLVREVMLLSIEALPFFDAIMNDVADEARLGDATLGVSPGGVTWSLGPLKKVQRVVEKLSLDPCQRAALDELKPDALVASGVLDTVRGMLTCNSMAHAHLVLRCLVQRFGKHGSQRERAHSVRSKNRYPKPSGGGWMDCLVNMAVTLPDGRDFVCEVQIVHAQLLTVRAELGAHHGYNDYRAGLELLEASGCAELGSGDLHAMKCWQTRLLFKALRGPDGQPLLAPDADERTVDATARRQTWYLSTVGGGRPWPRLLALDVGGSPVASVEAVEQPEVVVDALQGCLLYTSPSPRDS